MSSGDEAPKRDDVGHGRPPKEHQFKKNQSGNPKGRPSKARSLTPRQFRRDVIEVGQMMTTIMTPEGPKRMTFAQALIWRTATRAINHGPSLRLFMKWYFDALQAHSDAHPEHFKFLEFMEQLNSIEPEKHQSDYDQKLLNNYRKRTRNP